MDNKSLKVLDLSDTNITDDTCGLIIKALKLNTILKELDLCDNQITKRASMLIVGAVKDNSSLELLILPMYCDEVNKAIILLEEAVNKRRTSKKCNVKLKVRLISM